MRVAICGLDGRARWHDIWAGNPVIARPEDVAAGEPVRHVKNGPNCRPYILYPFTKDTGWTFSPSFRCRDHIAKIYLTDAERLKGEAAFDKYGPYVLIEPFTKHENFRWSMWAELVKACPDLTFVQHTHAESVKVPGVHYEPATFREACGLIAKASAYVRSESGLCHAAASFGIPQVTLFGGCMDAEVMGGYPGQECIQSAAPCGSWRACAHCQEAMRLITVEQVRDAVYRALGKGADSGSGITRNGEGASADHGRRQRRRPGSKDSAGQRDRDHASESASR